MKKASKRGSARKAKRAARRPASADRDTMRPEYDFKGAVRGRHAKRYTEGTNIVVLEPDVAARFPDAASVNRALRALGGIIDNAERPARSRRRRTA